VVETNLDFKQQHPNFCMGASRRFQFYKISMLHFFIKKLSCLLAMSKGDRKNMKTETKGCVLDIHFGGGTHFDLRCLTVVEKTVTNKWQLKNSTPATPCLCRHNREHTFFSNCSSGGHTDVATFWYLF
jgi:hypothetical protein